MKSDSSAQSLADEDIDTKIHAIADCLNNNLSDNLDLMEGKAGIALFWAYYSRYNKSFDLGEKIIPILKEIIKGHGKGNLPPTFAGGIAGIGWTIEHLKQNNFIELDTDSILINIDDFLYPFMIKYVQDGNYDFLHGALGLGLYFLSRKSNPKALKYISNLIDELIKKGEKQSKGIAWISIMPTDPRRTCYDLGLSHGIASLIVILSRFFEAKINCDVVKVLIEGAVNFLLSKKRDSPNSRYVFPGWIEDTEMQDAYGGRLAWCYYDLGISMALLQASKILKNEFWQKEALSLLINTTKITGWKESGISDASLCHGTAGIGHIYNRAYKYFHLPLFKNSSNYWFDQCLKIASYEDGLAGFKTFKPSKYGGIQNDVSFIEGIAGIGLAMISAVSDRDPCWDRALLLS